MRFLEAINPVAWLKRPPNIGDYGMIIIVIYPICFLMLKIVKKFTMFRLSKELADDYFIGSILFIFAHFYIVKKAYFFRVSVVFRVLSKMVPVMSALGALAGWLVDK